MTKRYIRFTLDTPFMGTEENHFHVYPEGTSDEIINYDLDTMAEKHASSYEYLLGEPEEESYDSIEEYEEEYEYFQAELDTYREEVKSYSYWEEITEQQFIEKEI